MFKQALPCVPDKVSGVSLTANDRLKRNSSSMLSTGLLVAVAVHVMLFWLTPGFTADDYAFYQEDLEVVDLPPEIEIPPPPEQIQRPAAPVVSEVQLDEDVTITAMGGKPGA